MPRNVKESDDEFETKGVRRTRTTGSSVLDSPLRRSTRIKQPVVHDVSSPESNSDVSSVGGTRNSRRRTITSDVGTSETTRHPRPRRNSATSDISEIAETDSTADSNAKRITRRSIAVLSTAETPTKLRTRPGTRAGSETKSTPPVGRVTRRTRASSMEPDAREELQTPEIGTPIKSRRRASALPSEPMVTEESEDVSRKMEKTVLELDEEPSAKSPKRSFRTNFDESSVLESAIDKIDRSIEENIEIQPDITHSPKNLKDTTRIPNSPKDNEFCEKMSENESSSSPFKSSSYTIDGILNKSSGTESEQSLSNKENEILNASAVSMGKNLPRKSLNSSIRKSFERHYNVDDETQSKIPSVDQENLTNDPDVTKEITTKRDYSLEAECVVVIEPMDVDQYEKNVVSKTHTPKIRSKQETPKLNEKEEIFECNKEITENEEIEDVIDNRRISNMESMTTIDSEYEKAEDETDNRRVFEIIEPTEVININENKKEEDEDDDLQIIERIDPTKIDSIDVEKSQEETTDDKIIDENISTNQSSTSVKMTIRGTSMDEENFEKSKENEDTTASPNIRIRRSSINKEDREKSEVNDPLITREVTSPSVEIRESSMDKDNPKKSEISEENIICEITKDRKSSIVTDSPKSGNNIEETSNRIEREISDESTEEHEKNINIENKSKVSENEEIGIFDSDNESESIVCPSFKDIPADEWNDNSKTKERNDDHSNNSFSTERNESECDLVLVDKDPWQPCDSDKEKMHRKNENSDSDDTVILGAGNVSKTKNEDKNTEKIVAEEEYEVVNEEIPMTVSSDMENEKEEDKSNLCKGSAKKRSSLNNSTKLRNENDTIVEKREKDSPLLLNDSRRKSLINVNSDSNDNSNGNVAIFPSTSSPFDSKRTPKAVQMSRRSLVGSIKRFNESKLDTNKESIEKSNDIPDKRKSLDKSLSCVVSAEIDEVYTQNDNPKSEGSENYLSSSKAREENFDKLQGSRKSLNGKNNSKIEHSSLDCEIGVEKSRESDDLQKKLEKLDILLKSANNRKSLNRKSYSKIQETSSDSENEEDEDFQPRLNMSSTPEGDRQSPNRTNNSKIQEASSDSENEEDEDLQPKLNRSSKSEGNRKSLNNKNNSKIQEANSDSENEEDEDLQPKLNRSSKSEGNRKSLNNKNNSKIQEASSDSENEEDEDLQPKLNRSSKSKGNRKSLNNKNNSKIQEANSDSENEEDEDLQPKLNRSSKSKGNRKSLNNKNNSKIQEANSDSENEEDEDLQPKLNRSSKSEGNRKSLNNKNNSKIQEASSDSENEEDEDLQPKLNRSSKSKGNRKSLNNKNNSKIQEANSDSENEEDEDLQPKLNRSSKSKGNRKSLNNKNNSKIQEASSDSENEEDEDLQPKLNRSSKSKGNRKSLNNKNNSKIQEASSDSENEEDEDLQPKLNRSSKSEGNRKSLNSKNNSQIQEAISDSENKEDEDLPPKLNRSSKSEGNRKSLGNKNNSKIQEVNSDSENEEDEDLQPKLNRSSKSEGNRTSLNNKNNSKIQEASSDSENEEDEDLQPKLNRSAKLKGNRKSLNNKNNSKIQEASSDSENEEDEDLQPKLNRSSKSEGNRKSLSFVANSNSNVETSSNDEDADSSRKIPRFLFDVISSASDSSASENEDMEKSIDSDIADDMNLAGKSDPVKYSDDDVPADDCMMTESESVDSEDDDGADLQDFVVDDDEDSYESSISDTEITEKIRKRIILRSNGDSDSLESDIDVESNVKELIASQSIITSCDNDNLLEIAKTPEKHVVPVKILITKPSVNVDNLDSDDEDLRPLQISATTEEISESVKTPKRDKNHDISTRIVEQQVISIGLNVSEKNSARKKTNSLPQSSTPKFFTRDLLPSEKSNSTKSNRSISDEYSSSKHETSWKSSDYEPINTAKVSKKLATSFKIAKAPKTPKTSKLHLRTSLPTDLNDSENQTNLSKVKSTRVTTLHQTMTTPRSDTPETRFLRKEKLNDTLPALKLQQRAKALRRSALANLRESPADEGAEEGIESVVIDEKTIFEQSFENEVGNSEKKKRRKKKKGINKSNANDHNAESIDATLNEITTSLNESQQSLGLDGSVKKAKKRKRNKKKAEEMVIEETILTEPEVPKKKTKRNKEPIAEREIVVNVEHVEKKKKKKKKVEAVEPVQEIIQDVETPERKKKKKKKVEAVEPMQEIVQDVETPERKKKKKKKIVQVVEPEVPINRKKMSRTSTQKSLPSDDPMESMTFSKSLISAFDNVVTSTKASKTANKIKAREIEKNSPEARKISMSSTTRVNKEKSVSTVKRLSDDILECLSEVAERPRKRRKIVTNENIVPSRQTLTPSRKNSWNTGCDDDFISLSSNGATTQFSVVDLTKIAKKSKKSVAAKTFRERMLARNPRQPISAYLMYQQKQKSSGKDRLY